MTKKKILTKCDFYVELFKDLNNVDRDNILEFMDFASLHLPNNSNLAFEIDQLKSEKFSKHANRIKDFININGSKSMIEKKNFLSDKNTFELLSILFAILIFGFGIGYWTKSFEIFSTNSKFNKSISISSVNSSDNIPTKK